MDNQSENNYRKNVLHPQMIVVSVLIVLAATLLADADALAASANDSNNPTAYADYHVQYVIEPDYTFTAQVDITEVILTESAAKQSARQQFFQEYNGNETDVVELLGAYTIKPNGERIKAIPMNQPSSSGNALSETNTKQPQFISYRQIEVGDKRTISYKIAQRQSKYPDNFVIVHRFLKSYEYDDVTVIVNAPLSMNLRGNNTWGGVGEHTSDHSTQTWIWKYSNKAPIAPSINERQQQDGLQITSFKDDDSLRQAQLKLHRTPSKVRNACDPYQGMPNDGPEPERRFAENIAGRLMFPGAEVLLGRDIDEWNDPGCVFGDGEPKIGKLSTGFGVAFNNIHDWDKSYVRVKFLRTTYPKSPFIALAEANYWVRYAWDARGTGYASSVTEDGWRLFSERLHKAENVLLETKEFSSVLPVWYEQMINVQSALNRPAEDIVNTFVEGAEKFKTFYPTYCTMLNRSSPKWKGSWEAVDKIVEWSVGNAKKIDGDSMYARLYWCVSDTITDTADDKNNIFKVTFAKWPKMKNGFEDLMIRYPNSTWNLNNFAKFSCQAGDKQTFLRLRQMIGTNIRESAWTNPTLQQCETKYGHMR